MGEVIDNLRYDDDLLVSGFSEPLFLVLASDARLFNGYRPPALHA